MKLRTVLMATTMAAGAALAVAPTTPAQAGLCPATTGVGGNATTCNLVIHFNSNGSVSTTFGPQVDYDGVEDALIG
jgi:hypothetical protein